MAACIGGKKFQCKTSGQIVSIEVDDQGHIWAGCDLLFHSDVVEHMQEFENFDLNDKVTFCMRLRGFKPA